MAPDSFDALSASEGEERRVRRDFPIFRTRDVVFLDSAASSQKPEAVINAISNFYSGDYANIHRGNYQLSVNASEKYDDVRGKTAAFLGAARSEEVIFTAGATAGINCVAYSWARNTLKSGDQILLSIMEHHSNIVPWQILAKELGLELVWIELSEDGQLNLEDLRAKLSAKTKLVSITQLSNVLGQATPLPTIIEDAHAIGARVLVDGAQGVCHIPTDLSSLGADFYVFSGHKLYGPSGIGVLYAKSEVLEQMPPFFAGGDMVATVSREAALYADLPYRFEAGTPHIAGVIGLGAALDYVQGLGFERIMAHESALLAALLSGLRELDGVRVLGPVEEKHALVSMVFENAHHNDVAEALSEGYSVAVRSGHHCAEPLHRYLGVSGSLRASFGIYNTHEDVQRFLTALERVLGFLVRQ